MKIQKIKSFNTLNQKKEQTKTNDISNNSTYISELKHDTLDISFKAKTSVRLTKKVRKGLSKKIKKLRDKVKPSKLNALEERYFGANKNPVNFDTIKNEFERLGLKAERVNIKVKEEIIPTLAPNASAQKKAFEIQCLDITQSAKTESYIIYFHGLKRTIEKDVEILKELATNLKSNILAVGYSGYSDNPGVSSRASHKVDARKALDYLVKEKKIKRKNVVVTGFSMGTGISTELASNKNLKALVLLSPPSSIAEMAKHLLQNNKRVSKWAQKISKITPNKVFRLIPLKNNYNNTNQITKVKCPILIVHSNKDTTIPISQAKKVAVSALEKGKDITFVKTSSGGHYTIDDKMPAVLAFFDKLGL